MRTIALVVAVLIGIPAVAQADTAVSIHIGLPAVLPPLVVVSPGVQVVSDFDEEVFFTGGFYWVRRDAVWYRSRVHTGGWVLVPGRTVPASLVKIPPGKYKRWKPVPAGHKGGGHPGGGHGGGGGKHNKHGKH